MKLFFRQTGSGFPVIILHGLYGSSDNWMSIAKQLSDQFRVIIPDQRNHGQSPHSPVHSYAAMANDLYELAMDLGLEKFHLVGHSMGGRVAMLLQSQHPEMVAKLVVVDVAPWGYHPEDSWFRRTYAEHSSIIESLKSVQPERFKTREEAERALSAFIPDSRLRQFLLKNFKRKPSGFEWVLNIGALEQNLEQMLLGVDVDAGSAKNADVLFIRGERSDYIPIHQVFRLKEVYPRSTVISIHQAGHWVHAEQPVQFIGALKMFLG